MRYYSGTYYELSNFNILLSEDKIFVSAKNNEKEIYVKGNKSLFSSPSENYHLVTSIRFPEESPLHIVILLLNNRGEIIHSDSLHSAYDLPHPLFAVDNNGTIGIFDYSRGVLVTLRSGKRDTIELDNIDFEMERTAFFKSVEEGFIGGTSVEPVLFGSGRFNVVLFSLNSNTKEFYQTNLNAEGLNAIETAGRSIFVSTYTPTMSGVKYSTKVFNAVLEEIKSYEQAFHSVTELNGTIVAVSETAVILLDSTLNQLSTLTLLSGEKAQIIKSHSKNRVICLFQKDNKYLLKSLKGSNFDEFVWESVDSFDERPGLSVLSGKLHITNKQNTIIIN